MRLRTITASLISGLFIWTTVSSAADTIRVRGYIKKDGTYVDPHERSRPNAFKWDNKNYKPSQEPDNSSSRQDTRQHDANWTTPNANRFLDNNPNNDYPQAQTYRQPRQAVAPTHLYEEPKQWAPSRQPSVNDGATERLAESLRRQRELRELREQQEQERRDTERREMLRRMQDDEDDQTNSYTQPSYPSYQPQTYDTAPTNRYNPINNYFESAPESDQLRYNPMNNSFHYADPNATLKYDAMSNTWDYK